MIKLFWLSFMCLKVETTSNHQPKYCDLLPEWESRIGPKSCSCITRWPLRWCTRTAWNPISTSLRFLTWKGSLLLTPSLQLPCQSEDHEIGQQSLGLRFDGFTMMGLAENRGPHHPVVQQHVADSNNQFAVEHATHVPNVWRKNRLWIPPLMIYRSSMVMDF